MCLRKNFQLGTYQARENDTGLTLIEIVIVIAIISITMAMTTISFGNPQQKQIEQHSARLNALIQLALEQAIFNGQDYALTVVTTGYAFYPPIARTPIKSGSEFQALSGWYPRPTRH